jgi:hypothetical protein
MALAGGALVLGVALYAAAPLVGPWVTGDSFTLPAVTVLGWAVYAAATATLQPYVSLAAARGRQRAALGVRLADGLVSLGTLGGLLAAGLPYQATPFVLAIGPVVGGLVTRSIVLAPMLRGQPAPQATRSTTSTASTPPVSADLVSAPPSGAHLGEAAHHAR